MPAVLLVEVGAADRAEPLAVGLAQHDEGGLHDERGLERLGEVDRLVGVDEGEVDVVVIGVVAGVGGLLKEVVLVDLAGDVELGALQAAVAGALDMAAQHARREDALAGVGEREVVVDAAGQLELVLAELIAGLVEVARDGERVAGVREALVEREDYRLHTWSTSLPGHVVGRVARA